MYQEICAGCLISSLVKTLIIIVLQKAELVPVAEITWLSLSAHTKSGSFSDNSSINENNSGLSCFMLQIPKNRVKSRVIE